MPTSKRQLFNLALAKVTKKRISSVDEDSNEANNCRELFPTVLDEVLNEHSWTDAVTIVPLVELTDAPPHGFSNRFQLPTNYIRLIQPYYDTSRDSFDFEWEKRGREFWTNQSTVYIKYVFLPELTESLSPNVISCLAQRLAYRLAFVLSTDKKREAQLLEEYRSYTLPHAIAVDSMESRYEEFEENPWIEKTHRPEMN